MDGVLFTNDEAPGALRNGTRVKKKTVDVGDTHPVGAMATVVGSLGPIVGGGPFDGEFCYFVVWDDTPNLPVFVTGYKIEAAVVS